jgi:hypothetical protein
MAALKSEDRHYSLDATLLLWQNSTVEFCHLKPDNSTPAMELPI